MRYLIILLFPLIAVAQDVEYKFGESLAANYSCVEYNLRIDQSIHKTDSVCYVSPLTRIKKKHILTVVTHQYMARFAILKSIPVASGEGVDGTGVYNGTLTLAVIIGRPDQLYAIREESRHLMNGEWRYYFSIHPIRQNERMPKPISGRVLEVSNQNICEDI